MPLNGLDFPQGVSLAELIEVVAKGERGRRDLVAFLVKQFGPAAADPLTVENLIELLAMYGFTGPLSNYLPPPCSAVMATNNIIAIAAGTTEKIGLPGCMVTGGVMKYRSIRAAPANRTAEDDVVLTQRIRAPKLYMGFFSNPSCGKRPGNFSTYENICIPCEGCAEFEFRNTNANSEARVVLTSESWVA